MYSICVCIKLWKTCRIYASEQWVNAVGSESLGTKEKFLDGYNTRHLGLWILSSDKSKSKSPSKQISHRRLVLMRLVTVDRSRPPSFQAYLHHVMHSISRAWNAFSQEEKHTHGGRILITYRVQCGNVNAGASRRVYRRRRLLDRCVDRWVLDLCVTDCCTFATSVIFKRHARVEFLNKVIDAIMCE